MKETIGNKHASISVYHKGAELCSFWDKEDGVEHIWQAYPDVWARHAPILFPIVGRLENDKLVAKGQTFEMKQHGFARDADFKLVDKTENTLLFELKSNEDTKAKYPYDFILQVKYTLEGKSLSVEYTVHNPSAEDNLQFSIGAHPGFTVPFNDKENFEDYYLEFENNETTDRLTLATSGLRDGKTICNFLNNDNIIELTPTLFDDDAIIFEDLKSESVSIKSKLHNKALTVNFAGFPLLGIWSKPKANAPYICIEPWYGVADEEGKGGNYIAKKALQQLAPQEKFNSKMVYSLN